MVTPGPPANPPDPFARERRQEREKVEMMARFRRDQVSTTVMLKDLTRFGTMIEGVGQLQKDEVVSLALPGCRPAMAFVCWANDHCAGLEFAEPLDNAVFVDLVARFGLGRQPTESGQRYA